MKDLSATLLAAQKKPDRLPYVEAKVYDFDQGIKRLSWERLYAGSEPDNHHGIAFDDQGSMHRIRVDGNNLYRQKITNPGPSTIKLIGSDDHAIEDNLSADRLFACQFTATASGTMDQFKLKASASGNVKVALYSNKVTGDFPDGYPDALLASVNDSQAVTAGWNIITFPDASITQGTTYWLAFNADAPIVGYYTAGKETRNKAYTFDGFTFPNPAPSDMAGLSTFTHLLAGCQSGESDYSQWTQLAADCQGPCAIAAYGAKIYIFYRTTGNVLWKYYSHDYGGSWNNAQLVAYADVLSMAATWWGDTSKVVCFALKAGQQNGIVLDSLDQSTTEHTWLGSVNHPFANTFGIGASYTPDHVDIVIAALESGDPYNLYGLYRQEFDNTYHFSDVEPFITSPAGEDITYEYPDCHNPASVQDYENTQLTAVEKYTGITAYTMPLICHSVRGSAFSSMAFTEPKPFLNITSHYGLRITSSPTHWWLERPDGVWRAPRAAGDPLDLTPNILSLRAERGNLVIELDNSSAQYATPPEKRSEVVLKLGYKTTEGNEAVEVGRYWIDSWEYSSSPNTSLITLHCLDGQGLADKWSARFQMRWPANKRVWEIIQEIICRWGINLTMPAGVPYSSASQNFYPDFTLQPGTRGDSALRHILSFIPDALIFEGNEAYVKDLRDDEASSYSYGSDHVILQGSYASHITLSRARALGRDDEDARIVEDAFDWPNLELGIDNLEQDYDPNLQSAARAQERADAILRKASLRAERGNLVIPVNCGQELYDVITVTDDRCGISSKKYRVLDIKTTLSRQRRLYQQRLIIGAP